jgi:hypothetical protein
MDINFWRGGWTGWVACVAVWPVVGLAQTTLPQVETARRLDQDPALRMEAATRPAEESEPVPASPGDDDLGVQLILKKREQYRPFQVFGDVAGSYTSNAFLTENGARGDYFFAGQVGASYQPLLGRDLLGEITVRQQWVRYERFDTLDFDSLNAGGGLTYLLRDLGEIAVFGRYNFNRLTYGQDGADGDAGSEFYKSHSLSAGLQKVFVVNRAVQVTAGQISEISFADPYIQQRNEYALYGGMHVKWTRHITSDLYYRPSYVDYVATSRNDWVQNVGLALGFQPQPWLQATVSASMAFNESDQAGSDYETFNTGLGIRLQAKF